MSVILRWIRATPSGVLLIAQLAIVIGYPFLAHSVAGRAALGVVQLIVVAAAVAAVNRTPATTWVAVVIGVPAMGFAVAESVTPSTDWVVLVSACLHVPLYVFVSYAMIRYLFLDDEVTRDELYATAAAFTVVAWGFAYAFAGIQVLWPGSFGVQRGWYDLLFLSFTTLTAVGLGDFTPVGDHARSVVMLEDLAGVFYVALVIARLVGLTISRSARRD